MAALFIIEKMIDGSTWNTIFKDKSEMEDDTEQTKKKCQENLKKNGTCIDHKKKKMNKVSTME